MQLHSWRSLGAMRGYDERSYGDGFADVYDEWYADVTDVDATVERMVELAGKGARVLELGVGTGRLAVPMAAAGLSVTGIDSSEAMLAKLAERDGGTQIATIVGDMVDDLPDEAFDAVLVAYNTIFNLVDEGAHQRLFRQVADRLGPDGVFVVEAFVPEPAPGRRLVDGRCPLDGGRPRRALGLEQPPRRPACRRPVHPSLRVRRCPAPPVVDPVGDAGATRRDGDRCRAPDSPIGGPTWPGPLSPTTARSTSRSTERAATLMHVVSGSAFRTAATSPTRRVWPRLARDAETAGWDGFFLWDHMIRRPPWQPMVDPWVTLAAVGCATERIVIGPMVTPLARRRVSVIARQTATLDRLAAGRLRLGVGLGAPDDEFTRFGEDADPKRRAQILDESLDALAAALVGRARVVFRGAHVVLDEVEFTPTPVHGRVPIWVAGVWPGGAPFRRAARFDGVWPVRGRAAI